MRIAPGDRLDREHSLVERLVRKLKPADDVAHRADPGLAGPEHRIDGDDTAVDGDPGPLDADVLDVGCPAHRDQQDLGLEPLLLAVLVRDGHRDAALVALDRAEVETVPGQAGDTASLELAAELDADGGVLERHEARQHLDDRDLGTAAAIERRKLDPHRARAEHDRGRRDPVHPQRLVAGEDHRSRRRECRGAAWAAIRWR